MSNWTSRWCMHPHCAAFPVSMRTVRDGDMQPLFKTVVGICPPPDVDADGPLQLQVNAARLLELRRRHRHRAHQARHHQARHCGHGGHARGQAALGEDYPNIGLPWIDPGRGRVGKRRRPSWPLPESHEPKVSDTLCDPATPEPLPSLTVDEPTISMTFRSQHLALPGREGKFVTSRQIRERLERRGHPQRGIAGRNRPRIRTYSSSCSAAGELHLGVLLENMRREGYEMAVPGRAWSSSKSTAPRTSRTSRSPSTPTPTRRATSCRRSAAAAPSSRICRRMAAAASAWTTWCRRAA